MQQKWPLGVYLVNTVQINISKCLKQITTSQKTLFHIMHFTSLVHFSRVCRINLKYSDQQVNGLSTGKYVALHNISKANMVLRPHPTLKRHTKIQNDLKGRIFLFLKLRR